ncbi:hypothetical protein SAMN02745823_03836 [Sporobacter termitidis DSM 10068]|uniref:AP2 domain-containing protein n=1 Tax=Sporobacter termitidis DSM 10068 TaxID=1123282 RepID=A0A1M5ZHW9_9FIRM|nr:hypothetical protein [Sporobacter termitidis]SHI23748.1 hypothetical protein SAMN02745823_03758 [Sporobacter termitidis DSM 10068]SHI24440.1 hypothetical protein SAMN02745823_03836 [Sporobacter termitidis DSM 10068]
MGHFIDITGKRYGKLTALYPTEKRDQGGSVMWHFRCDCGNEKDMSARPIKAGTVKSCGCIAKPHGKTGTRLFTIWVNMRQRCSNPNYSGFQYWGGKGVTVCAEWQDFTVFEAWSLAHGYSDKLTIDRIDGGGNYEPSNCRWSTPKEQAHNTASNHLITIGEQTKTLSDWCEQLGTVSLCSIHRRVRTLGWSYEKALTTPPMRSRRSGRGKTEWR